VRVFRLSRKKYGTQLSGMGAARLGGRWNSRGVEIIYTADSRALALAEVVVHLSLTALPKDFMMMAIELPKNAAVQQIRPEELPEQWQVFPPVRSLKSIGDRFVALGEALVLQVPSAVVPGDYNYLINPHHVAFDEVRVVGMEDFRFDPRLTAG